MKEFCWYCVHCSSSKCTYSAEYLLEEEQGDFCEALIICDNTQSNCCNSIPCMHFLSVSSHTIGYVHAVTNEDKTLSLLLCNLRAIYCIYLLHNQKCMDFVVVGRALCLFSLSLIALLYHFAFIQTTDFIIDISNRIQFIVELTDVIRNLGNA